MAAAMCQPGAMSDPTPQVRVTREHNPDRFEISVGGEVAGFAQFVDHQGRRVFFHTVTEPRFEGQGLAGQVVTTALSATRDEGLRAVPVCPYVAAFLRRHHEFDDIAVEVTAADLAAIPD